MTATAHLHTDRHSDNQLAREIASLGDLDAGALKARWLSVTGKAPSPGIRGELLVRCLAYLMQEKALGGLSIASRKQLDVLAQEAKCGEAETAVANPKTTQRRLMPGTRLVREWQGTSHKVIVIPDGFLWQGASYASLSTVARAITGTSWNGWVFFGAKARREAARKSPARQTEPAAQAPAAASLHRTDRVRPRRFRASRAITEEGAAHA